MLFEAFHENLVPDSPVSQKLKYSQNVNEPQLTKVAQHPVALKMYRNLWDSELPAS